MEYNNKIKLKELQKTLKEVIKKGYKIELKINGEYYEVIK